MDPLSQGVVGATFSQSIAQKTRLGIAAVLGFLSGMAADLDVFIRSDQDHLLFLEYHRQFTHSLVFMPVGGLLCALIFYFASLKKRGLSFFQTYAYCTAGYATHAFLDACTSYGTQLFWPFSNHRVSWNNISIIDPLFTFPILIFVVLAAVLKKKSFARIALIYTVFYLLLGFVQQERAKIAAYDLAESRGHDVIHLEVKPSLANVVLWKSVYETADDYHVDAVHVFEKSRVIPGESIQKLKLRRDFAWLDFSSVQAADIQRFSWFSQGFVAKSQHHEDVIVDVRYSLIPNQIRSLWGIQLSRENQNHHTPFLTFRNATKEVRILFWRMLTDPESFAR